MSNTNTGESDACLASIIHWLGVVAIGIIYIFASPSFGTQVTDAVLMLWSYSVLVAILNFYRATSLVADLLKRAVKP